MRPPKSKKLWEAESRVGKEVAHITTFRIGRELSEKDWDYLGIALEVLKVLRFFFENVPPSRMPAHHMEWFNQADLKVVVVPPAAHTASRST